MSGPIYTVDDLASGRHYDEGDLEWDYEGHYFTASLQLDEGDTGPLDVEGPCLAVYRMPYDQSDLTVVVTEL